MPEGHSQNPSGIWRLLVFCAVGILLSTAFWIVVERRAAKLEYEAYNELRNLGASGDDWISFREIITSKPPVVQVNIPSNIPIQIAFRALPKLKNLETLTLAYPSLTADQLAIIEKMKLDSLSFEGEFPDSNVQELARFRGLRFLHVPATNFSISARSKLMALLPTTRIDFE